MAFKRTILQHLKAWRENPHRKPLILRGARQVGKTTVIKQLSQEYKHSILLNLEKPDDLSYFLDNDKVSNIVEALFLSKNISTEATSQTLLFIDEIQESPKAIGLLRYFYEEVPELHVITAGSLLEFALRKVKSFPVGRVEYLYLHPFNFYEYLEAIGHQAAIAQFNEIPIKPFAHKILMDLFNRFAIIGGMPEVVKIFIEKNSLTSLPKVYESIWATYKNDVEKYASSDTDQKVIKHILFTAHLFIDQRIKFQNFGNSNYRSREVGKAMHNLDAANIIRLIYPTSDIEIPARPDIRKAPRLQFLDTGIINYTLGVQANMLALKDLSTSHKGAIIPHLVTQEFISLNTINDPRPNFWVREKSQASSEVDLVYTHEDKIIPIEIKSGSAGKLRSLHQFMERTNHPYAVRIYGGEFLIHKSKTSSGTPFLLMNMPYYLGTKIPDYMEYFVNNYHL